MLSKKDYLQAASLFLSAKSYIKALESYKSNGDWKEVMNLAKLLNFSEDKRIILANEMTDYLNTIGKYSVNLILISFKTTSILYRVLDF